MVFIKRDYYRNGQEISVEQSGKVHMRRRNLYCVVVSPTANKEQSSVLHFTQIVRALCISGEVAARKTIHYNLH